MKDLWVEKYPKLLMVMYFQTKHNVLAGKNMDKRQNYSTSIIFWKCWNWKDDIGKIIVPTNWN